MNVLVIGGEEKALIRALLKSFGCQNITFAPTKEISSLPKHAECILVLDIASSYSLGIDVALRSSTIFAKDDVSDIYKVWREHFKIECIS